MRHTLKGQRFYAGNRTHLVFPIHHDIFGVDASLFRFQKNSLDTAVLGNRQFSDMTSLPEEMQTPCFLSRYVYVPARHLRHGLPISEWDESGYRRTLVDYREDETVKADLFTLPETYEKFRPDH